MKANQVGLQYLREIPLRSETDVLVCGGGPAGVAAALAARRQGASVRLIEAHSSLGGMGCAGMVPGFCQFTDGVNFLADGIGRLLDDAALRRRLAAAGLNKVRRRHDWPGIAARLAGEYEQILSRHHL